MHRQDHQRGGGEPRLRRAAHDAVAEEHQAERQPGRRVGPHLGRAGALPDRDDVALEDVAHLERDVAEQQQHGEHGGAHDVPVGPHAARGAGQQHGGQARHQVGQQQRAEDGHAEDAVAAEQRVLDDAEAEHDEDGRKHAERQRGETEDGVGAAEIEPHQHVGEAEAHQREQPLLDVARGVGQRIAAVERVADLEEHQQRREQHAERIAHARGEVFALAS